MIVDICSIMYNEEVLLESWIKSWLKIPFVNQIYLIDGGSTDKSREIASSYAGVKCVKIPWRNSFAIQRNWAIKQSKKNVDYIIQPDIDEIPCLEHLSPKSDEIEDYDYYQLPYLKYYDFNKLWFFNNGNTPKTEDDKVYFGHKATISIIRKSVLNGWSNNLHEQPSFNTNPKTNKPLICDLQKINKQFHIGHFDQAKHFEEARQRKTNVYREMGLKRVRYRLIKPAVYSGKSYDKQWAELAIQNANNGDYTMIEEIGREQYNSFMREHRFLTE